MIVTASGPDRVEIFETTSELAKAEKPRPPYSFGMLRPKNLFSLDEFPCLGLRSPFLYTSQSGLSLQSSSTGPFRNSSSSPDIFLYGSFAICCKIRFTGKKVLAQPKLSLLLVRSSQFQRLQEERSFSSTLKLTG